MNQSSGDPPGENFNLQNEHLYQQFRKVTRWYLFMVHTPSDGRIISEYLTGRDRQGSSDGLI
jgi:hypothetical protein